jgi:UDP-N-acetyl-2-amino-2-deoxyglucuronate dehydrogenase
VMTDKPGATTASEAARSVAAARAGGVKLAVAFTRRYGQGWRDAKAMVETGRLGTLFASEAIFTTSSVAVRDPANLIFSRERMGGGILHWLGVHDVDLLLWLTGERIVELQAMAGTVGGAPIEVEDAISISLRYERGAIGTAHFAYALPRTGGDGYLALRGSAGSIRLQPDGTLTWLGPGTHGSPVVQQTTTYQMRPAPGYGWAGGAILSDLLDAIAQDREPLANGAAMVAALRVIDAAYASATTGQRVRIDWDSV